MWFVYVLRSDRDGDFYVGSTNNLERRLVEHNRGESLSVRNKGPFKLVYCEEYATKKEAIIREKQIKSYKSGIAFKKLLVKGSTPSSSLVQDKSFSSSRHGFKSRWGHLN